MLQRLTILFACLMIFTQVKAGESEQRILLGIYAQTHRCFKEATLAIRVAGVSDPDKVTDFTMNTCGGPLRTFLTKNAKLTNHEVERLLYIFAYDYYLQLQRLL